MLTNRNVNIVLVIILLISLLFFKGYFFIIFLGLAWVYIGLTIYGVFNIQAGYFLKTHCFAPTSEKIASLTFDDGIDTELTPQILDILLKYDIKATFFIVGKTINNHKEITGEILEKNIAILNRINDEGHLIGNHTYKHLPTLSMNSPNVIYDELELTHKLIQTITGKSVKFFRPPYGVTNPSIRNAVKKMGYDVIGWSLRSFDTKLTPDKVMKRITRKLSPGSIILLHDNRKNTTEHLSEYIEYILSQNYKFIRLDQHLGIPAYEN